MLYHLDLIGPRAGPFGCLSGRLACWWVWAVRGGWVSRAIPTVVLQVTLAVRFCCFVGVGCLWRSGKQRDPFLGAAGGTHMFVCVHGWRVVSGYLVCGVCLFDAVCILIFY